MYFLFNIENIIPKKPNIGQIIIVDIPIGFKVGKLSIGIKNETNKITRPHKKLQICKLLKKLFFIRTPLNINNYIKNRIPLKMNYI